MNQTRKVTAAIAASNINALRQLVIDSANDAESKIRAALLENNYAAPTVTSHFDAWDIINDHEAEEGEPCDFSACGSALQAVTLEANAILQATYDTTLEHMLSELTEALTELECREDLQIDRFLPGSCGLNRFSNDDEESIANGAGTLHLWRSLHIGEISLNGLTLTIHLTHAE